MNAKRPYMPEGCDQQGRVTPTKQRQQPANELRGVITDRMLDDLSARNRQRLNAVKQKQADIGEVVA